jgi:hypothetical protein
LRGRKHFPAFASGLVPEQVLGKCKRGALKGHGAQNPLSWIFYDLAIAFSPFGLLG